MNFTPTETARSMRPLNESLNTSPSESICVVDIWPAKTTWLRQVAETIFWIPIKLQVRNPGWNKSDKKDLLFRLGSTFTLVSGNLSLYIYIGRYIQSNCIHLQQTNLEKLNHLQCDWPRSIYYCEQVRVFSLQAIFLWNGIWVICFCWPGGLSWFDIKIGTLPEANKTPEKIGPWKRRFRTWKPPFLGTKLILFQEGTISCETSFVFFPNVYSIRLERFERTPAENRCH